MFVYWHSSLVCADFYEMSHHLQYCFWNNNVFATALAEVHVHWMWVTCCRLHEARCRLKETGIISS